MQHSIAQIKPMVGDSQSELKLTQYSTAVPEVIAVHLQHNGKQNEPMCGARSEWPLHRGSLPQLCIRFSMTVSK